MRSEVLKPRFRLGTNCMSKTLENFDITLCSRVIIISEMTIWFKYLKHFDVEIVY